MKPWQVPGLALPLLLGHAAPAAPGAWTLPGGERWFRIGFMLQATEERYFLDGRRIPYFFEGRNETEALFVDFRWAPRDRLELGAQMPFSESSSTTWPTCAPQPAWETCVSPPSTTS
jgi:hypothetical protein